MPNFDTYWMVNDPIDAAGRAVDAWNRIQADKTTITLQGAGAAITVRIEHDGDPSDVASDAGQSDTMRCTIFGVRDHPDDAVADTVIAEGNRFRITGNSYLSGNIYVVQRIATPPGEVQAFAESV